MTRLDIRFALAAWLLMTAAISASDYLFHVRTGVLDYHWNPQVDGQSVWVVPTFAGAVALMLWLGALLPTRNGGVRWPTLAVNLGLFGAVYFASGQLADSHPGWLLAGASALWLVRFLLAGDRTVILLVSVVLGVLGPLAESLFSALGLFDYAVSDALGVPLWLVLLWMIGAFVIVELARGLRRPLSGS